MRSYLFFAVIGWGGATLLISQLRAFSRPRLAERLAPYASGESATRLGNRSFSLVTVRDVIGPLASNLGGRIAGSLGITEDLSVRLQRIHSEESVATFRMRQLGIAGAALGVTAISSVGLQLSPLVAVILILAAPLLAFCLVEHKLSVDSARHQHRVRLELPVIAEQLGTLLSAGWSLGSAVDRIAQRSNGVVAEDLRRVRHRVNHGLSEEDAMREWAGVVKVVEVDRLVAVLALNRESGDIGRLISNEARSIRADSHRALIEEMEKKNQMVWIPVTVATLVPGVILLAIPFMQALKPFAE